MPNPSNPSHPAHSTARPGSPEAIAPLAGYTVAVASDRRRHQLAALLESVGARTVSVQAARSVARPDPAVLRDATARCLAMPCDELVVSSALGLRAWLSAARREGLAGRLVARFGQARLLARDPAAADALRALGLTAVFSSEGETTEELLRYLLAQPLAGRRIVIQTNQLALSEVCPLLRAAGAEVIEVPTYAVAPPAESYSLRRLCDLILRRQVDALALVGTPVAGHLRDQAAREDRLPALRRVLRDEVMCVTLGAPPTGLPPSPPSSLSPSEPAGALPLPAVLPERPFVEEIAELVLRTLPGRGIRLAVAGHQLEVRGQAVVLDGRLIPVPGGPMVVLRALAREPGQVLTAAEIRRTGPEWSDVDDHAVEMAVSRLRRLLAGTDLVQTVINHGYRLAA